MGMYARIAGAAAGSPRLRCFLVILPVVLLLILAYFLKMLEGADSLLNDFLTRSYAPRVAGDNRIVLVNFSDGTRRNLGLKAPVPRKLYRRFIEIMHSAGTRAVFFDIFLGATIYEEQERDLIELSRRIGKVAYIVRTAQSFDELEIEDPIDGRMTAERDILVHPDFDETGIIRSLQAFKDNEGRRYQALSVKALSLYRGVPVTVLDKDPPGYRRQWYLPPGQALQVGGQVIPLAGRTLYINYMRCRGVRYFDTYAFEDVISGRIPPNNFKDRIVIFGTAAKLDHDIHDTPVGELYGMEIHGLMLANLLDGTNLRPVRPEVVVAATVPLFLLCVAALPAVRPLTGFAFFISSVFAVLVAAVGLRIHGITMNLSPLLLTLAVSWTLSSLSRTQAVEKEFEAGLNLMEGIGAASVSPGEEESAPPSEWLSSVLDLACGSLGASVGWIQILDGSGAFHVEAACRCAPPKNPEDLKGGLCEEAIEKKHYLIGPSSDAKSLSDYETGLGAFSLLAVPLISQGKATGALALGKKFPSTFTASQVKHVLVLGTLVSGFLENAKLNRRIGKLFLDAITSLARAVDARDPYTFGHSERVARLGKILAQRLGLPPDEAARIETAGLLHDIGKIGVPEAVLRNPGRLTAEEFTQMKAHPDIAVKILSPLDEIYSLIPFIAGHHEKMDGGGYPGGLRGEEIPTGARILAVADVFDALTSERPYRKSSTRRDAMDLMEREFSSHLDGNIVRALREYLVERGDL
jgi:HD-GYP domain-containing protein (c-di-GMP phosphodiesterase class II)/CHASE2 domain-containing sensor protein